MQYKLDQPVKGQIGTVKYQCSIEWRNGRLIADEPEKNGGADSGPDPYTLLLSSLASCTLITLRMYIDRKEWHIDRINVQANLYQEMKDGEIRTVIDRDIVFPPGTDKEQKDKLMEIAKACPISKILEHNIQVRTFVLHDEEAGKEINYRNDEITVSWRPEFCQHSTRCWKDLLQVFDPRNKKWINADGAPAERIKAQVAKCPSGALGFAYNQPEKETPA